MYLRSSLFSNSSNLLMSSLKKKKNISLLSVVMSTRILYTVVVLLQLLIPISANHSPYVHTDLENIINYDCGGASTETTLKSKTAFGEYSNVTTTVLYRDSPKDSAGYPKQYPKTSYPCIIRSQFTYTFPVVTVGYKFIRLHFFPTSYPGLNMSKALFSVAVGPYTLLTTSESSYTLDVVEYIVKEFCINVNGPVLNITFTPTRNSTSSFAFVNKIQIVSMPSNLYVRGDHLPLPLLLPPIGRQSSSHELFFIRNSIALEMMYRVNVGGRSISGEDDTGMFRVWSKDNLYLIGDSKHTTAIHTEDAIINYSTSSTVPEYTAPAKVYATARTNDFNYWYSILTWYFPLDPGFYYLIRLHFCEISTDVTRANQRVFQIYINNQTAESHADLIQWSSSNVAGRVPIYKDYVANLTGLSSLTIQLAPRERDHGAILNGLEIFKLSDHSNKLAGMYPFLHRRGNPFGKSNDFPENHLRLVTITMRLLGGLLVLTLVYYLFLYFPPKSWCRLRLTSVLRSKWKMRAFVQFGASSSDHCRYFSFQEIKSATNNFSESNLIGAGGFGKVYKGNIDIGGLTSTFVAIKRLSPTSNQGLHEFQTEITTLPKLRHCHLVSLIGYCMDEKEMILVYDYMARGTLRDHLYNTREPPLPWKRRLEICSGAARGLHYLHAGTKQTIIHRDVKSTNILLDKRWVAKVADFGLSKAGPTMLSCTHISTAVKGSFGYLDPEYCRRQKLTEKSDVYSFGVVLFEALCARPAVLPMAELEEEDEEEEHQKVNLAYWALHCHQRGSLDQIIDPYLMGKIDHECFKTYTEIARKCLADRGCDRPSMGDVLWNLELASLQQQGGDAEEEEEERLGGEIAVMIDGNSDPTPGAEFSEILAPIGR